VYYIINLYVHYLPGMQFALNYNKNLTEENTGLIKTSTNAVNRINKTKRHSISSKKNRSICQFLIIGFWCLIFGLVVLSFPWSTHAAQVTLAWDKSSGAVGYKIYSGTASNSYSWVVDVGNVTTYTTANLTDGYTYYFAAKAYDASFHESDYSAEVSYKAVTTATTYIISASAGTGGTISPSGSVSVTSGSSKTFTITPNSGYKISNVTVNGSSVGAVSSYTFSNVTANRTISATFAVTTSPGS
jgi:hypothetical protein